jgi:hypothetical protein
MGNRLHQICSIAWQEYQRFFHKSTCLMMLFSLVYFLERIVFPMAEICRDYGFTANPVEGYLHILSVSTQAFMVPLMFTALLADFPSRQTDGYFTLIRTKRTTWLLGQILYGLALGLSYLLLLLVGTGIFLLPYAQWGSWGTFNTILSQSQPELYLEKAELFLDTETVTHGSPLKTTLVSTGLALCYLMVVALLLLLFRLLGWRGVGLLVTVLLTLSGFVIVAMKLPLMWLSPLSHSIFGAHFEGFLRKSACPLWASGVYFGVLLLLLLGANEIMVKKCRLGGEAE